MCYNAARNKKKKPSSKATRKTAAVTAKAA
jgi:hypothetical protein